MSINVKTSKTFDNKTPRCKWSLFVPCACVYKSRKIDDATCPDLLTAR